VADGALHIPDVPEGSRYPELAEMLGRRAAADASLVVAARSDPNKFVEACGRIEGQVWVSKQAGAHRMWQDHFTRASALPGASTACLLAPVGHGKCGKRGTPVETARGPVAIEAVEVGDRVAVLDPASPHELVWAPVERTYECGRKAIVKLTTSTGRVLEVASTHPLYVFDQWRLASELKVGDWLMAARSTPEPETPSALTREEAAMLGYFAGDGGLTQSSVSFTNFDAGVVWAVKRLVDGFGWRLRKRGRRGNWAILCSDTKARGRASGPLALGRAHGLNCLSIHKHVPPAVLAGSDGVVTAFVGAYFECDGHVNPARGGSLEFASSSWHLLDGTRRLLLRFGIVARLRDHPVPYKGERRMSWRLLVTGGDNLLRFRECIPLHGEKRIALRKLDLRDHGGAGSSDVVPRGWEQYLQCSAHAIRQVGVRIDAGKNALGRHRRTVRACAEVNPSAVLSRRPSSARPNGNPKRLRDLASELVFWDRIVAVEQGGEDECFDIEVGHPAHCYLANGVVTHNSQQTTRWRVLYELGRNPNLRVLMLSATSQLPEKMLSGIKADIEHNAFVQAVFPHLRPGRKKGQNSWSNTQIHVERSDHLTDPSIECAGLTTKILGKRADLIAVDDLLNTENTLTPYMRKQVWDRVQAEALSRRPPHLPSRAWFLGHPWTEDDALAQACLQPGSRVLRTGARVQRTNSGRIITSADPEWNELIPWFPLLPELWTKATLQQRMTSLGWASRFMLDCLFMKRGAGGFTDKAIALALMNGRGVSWKNSWNPIATGAPTYTGVDLSTGEGDDETVIFTAARMPNNQRRILEIQAGKWEGPEILERIRGVHARYRSTIAVESNGFQRVLRQFIRNEDMFITPVLDHHTGGNKHALKWGIKAMALELAPPGQWIFPRPADMLEPVSPEMASLVHGALNFSSDAKHTSDYVMAWWICWLQMAKDEGLSLA